jgi:hypothetical protein
MLFLGAVLLLSAGFAPPAWAALADLGVPASPHGYPAFYRDANGLALEPCLPPPAGNATREDLCVFEPLDLASPILVAGETFWWMGDASVAMPGGGAADLVLAIEGTFGGDESPVDGQQISFGRVRIRIDTPVTGTYTVTHPYGSQVFVVGDEDLDGLPDGINYTADIGAANFLDPALGFRGTLTSPIGPFLTWPNYTEEASLKVFELDELGQPTSVVLEQYVGDPNVPHVVTDGTARDIIFRVQGPAFSGTPIDVQTNLFTVMGKVLPDPPPVATEHAFPGVPPRKLFAAGPVNRPATLDQLPLPAGITVTGTDFPSYPVGYPLWYQDNAGTIEAPAAGIQVTLCPGVDPMCISDPIIATNPNDPTVLLRTGGETFWWSADARFDTPAGRALLVLGLEATFGGDESVADGQQITFGRLRIRVDTSVAGTYRVTHPYGQITFTGVPADDRGINYTADIGIADPANPDGSFLGTLYSDIGPALLTWPDFANSDVPGNAVLKRQVDPNDLNSPVIQYVGDPAIEHIVTGSPTGNNVFRVERQVGGNWELVGETDLFAVSGKIYDPATFEVGNPNAPLAIADGPVVLNLANESSVPINALTNDQNLTLPATITVVTQAGQGTAVANNPAGTITYTPGAALAAAGGIDTFTYRFVDASTLTSNIATVTVNVVPVENFTPTRARLDLRRLQLEVQGASNFEGTTLTIHAGPTANGPDLGTALVSNGRWRFRGTVTSNLDVTSISIVSSTGKSLLNQPLQVR